MVWRYWITFDSADFAQRAATWMRASFGGRSISRPTLRFRNIVVDERAVMFDATYIARSANTHDINRVLAKMCLANGGHWDGSIVDLMFVLLLGRQRGDAGEKSTWPDVSDQDYEVVLRRRSEALKLMGGLPVES